MIDQLSQATQAAQLNDENPLQKHLAALKDVENETPPTESSKLDAIETPVRAPEGTSPEAAAQPQVLEAPTTRIQRPDQFASLHSVDHDLH